MLVRVKMARSVFYYHLARLNDVDGYADMRKRIKAIYDENKGRYGKPFHPQTQGKIERYHRSMKNVIKLNHHFCPSELEKAIDGWVKYYNESRFHESLDNLTPREVYLGQGEKIKRIRETIKQNSINKRISENKRMILQHK